jgi:hypothetical protein
VQGPTGTPAAVHAPLTPVGSYPPVREPAVAIWLASELALAWTRPLLVVAKAARRLVPPLGIVIAVMLRLPAFEFTWMMM